ncbi:MAG TPA: T9SS type A sorting domain-containing protein [Bacteroidia bacterium]|nr:T9SS type A sorting domain-containing protein [Bacteroidia bacterium]
MKQYTRILFAILILSAIASPSFAQQNTFSTNLFTAGINDGSNAVIENSAGNYLVAGFSYSGSNSDIYLSEINNSGNLLQSAVIGSASYEIPRCLLQAAGGYYIVAGSIYDSPSDNDWFITKLDNAFNIVWFKRMGATGGNDYANSCFEVSPNHFVFTGTVGLSGSAKPSVVMIDSSGTVIHEGYMTTNQFASPNYRGRYLGNGEIGFANLANSISILDTTGNIVKQGSFSIATFTRDVVSAPNGGYAVCGVFGYGSPSGSSLAFGVCDNNLTSLSFAYRYSLSGYDVQPVMMHRDAAGKYVIAVNAFSLSSGNALPLVVILDSAGTFLSARSYLPAGSGNITLNSLIPTSDGGYLIAGGTGISSFVAKLDAAGGSCSAINLNFATTTINQLSASPHSLYSGNVSILASPVAIGVFGGVNSNLNCSSSTGIEILEPAHNQIKLYPSLFKDGFYISQDNGSKESVNVTLYEITGRKVADLKTSGDAYISTPGLASGTYFVRVTDRNGAILFKGKAICAN